MQETEVLGHDEACRDAARFVAPRGCNAIAGRREFASVVLGEGNFPAPLHRPPNKIEFLLGNAAHLIPNIQGPFDLVFIDADKPNYSNYYDLVFPRLSDHGFIIADNVLWSGKVLETEKDENTQALYDFSKKVLADDRVENVLLPIRDGLMVIRKKEAPGSMT